MFFCLCSTGELSNNLMRCQSFDHVLDVFLNGPDVVSLQGSAPVLSRFPRCLVNRAVLLDKPDCALAGRSLEHGVDQLLP